MNSAIELTQHWMIYQPAIVALTLLCLCVLVQSSLTAPLAFINKQQAPGMPLQGDHQLLSFRVLRTHLNSVESLAPFGLAVLLAVLVGTHAITVNWLVSIHVAFRLLFWVVYYSGIGKVAGGIRTFSFIGGLLSNIILVAMVFITAVL